MIYEEQQEKRCQKEREEIRKRMEDIEREKAAAREADRERKREREHGVLRKLALKPLERGNIPVVLSRAIAFDPAIYISLRHV